MLLGKASSEERQRRFREIMACRPTPEPATKGGLASKASWTTGQELGDGFPPLSLGHGRGETTVRQLYFR